MSQNRGSKVRGAHPRSAWVAKQRLVGRHSQKAGLAPGTFERPVAPPAGKVAIRVFSYDASQLAEDVHEQLGPALGTMAKGRFTWIDVEGGHDAQIIQQLGDGLGVDPLILEDIANIGQRPKMEDLGDQVFVGLQHVAYSAERGEILASQVSLILGPSFLVSLVEHEIGAIESVRQRLRAGSRRLRTMGSGYLAYALADSIVDSYFGVLETLGARTAAVEEALSAGRSIRAMEEIHKLQTQLMHLRQWAWPVRELVSELQRSESRLIGKPLRPFLRDLQDNLVEIIEITETYREMVAGLLSLYHSVMSENTNAVMRVLTVVATFFIPLTFIVGVYGMNFNYMPELAWRWSYPVLLASMLAIAAGMALYFKKKRWF